MKVNSSAKMNKEFNNQVSYMSIHVGIDLHVARNVLRFRRSLKTTKKNHVFTDPKTGLPLTQDQWTGPALRLANKVGVRPDGVAGLDPDETWGLACARGMVNEHGLLLTIEDARVLFAKIPNNPFETKE